jgi:LPXTG-motif cell wall-anchored protein
MRKRTIAVLAGLFLGMVGTAVIALPASAAVTAQQTSVARAICEAPTAPAIEPADSQLAAEQSVNKMTEEFPNFLSCLKVTFTDKCDGTVVIHLQNDAVIDGSFSRFTVRILGKDYLVKGGPDAEENAIDVTVPKDKNEDIQLALVFVVSKKDGSITIVHNYLDPHTWELPDACPTASATPSSAPTTAPVTTKTVVVTSHVVVPASLPVTGKSLTPIIGTAGLAVAVTLILGGVIIARRRRDARAIN